MPLNQDFNQYVSRTRIITLLSSENLTDQHERAGTFGEGFKEKQFPYTLYFEKSMVEGFLTDCFSQAKQRGFYNNKSVESLVRLSFDENLISCNQAHENKVTELTPNEIRRWIFKDRLSAINISLSTNRSCYRLLKRVLKNEWSAKREDYLKRIEAMKNKKKAPIAHSNKVEQIIKILSQQMDLGHGVIREYVQLFDIDSLLDYDETQLFTEGNRNLYPIKEVEDLKKFIKLGRRKGGYLTSHDIENLRKPFNASRTIFYYYISQGELEVITGGKQLLVCRDPWIELRNRIYEQQKQKKHNP